jgi:WD40 repeat protein
MWIQKVPGGGVEGLAYSPDGKTLYSSDRSGWVTAWDVANRAGRRLTRVADIERCNPVRVSTLSDRLLLIHGLSWIVWDLERNAEQSRVPVEYAQWVCKQTPARLYSRGPDRRSVLTWELGAAQPGPVFSDWNLAGDLRSFDLTRDGKLALLTDKYGHVTLYDLEGSRELDRFEPQFQTGVLHAARFSPAGDTLLLVAGQRVRLWDVRDRAVRGEVVVSIWSPSVFLFHPHARAFVALDRDTKLTLFSLAAGEPIRSFDFALGRYVQCVRFSPDGLTCAVGGSNKQFAVFDVDL